MKLRYKLALYNLFTKGIFVAIFLLLIPWLLERINLYQTDLELIDQREQIMDIVSVYGVDEILTRLESDTPSAFYIYKQQYVSLNRASTDNLWNFIEISTRMVDGEAIDYRVLVYSFRVNGKPYLLEIGISLERIYRTEQNIRIITLVMLALFVLIAFITDTSMTRLLTQPLTSITQKLKNTKSPAHFDHKPVQTTTTDFVYLDKTISDLMHQIEELFAKEKEITANISHELLTPVSVVQSRLENLIEEEGLSDGNIEKISDSLRTLHRLKGIINSLLLIARVENKQFLKQDAIWLNELMAEVIEEIDPIANEKGIEIIAMYESDHYLHEVNRSLIFTLFFNILNNAVKFSEIENKGPVEVRCQKSNNIFIVKITDHGPGMTSEQAAEIFQRFRKRKS
ncbi:MAG TPA: HAMP domain-containing sensor histidine kinase, partial [Bacteroidales bacterium]|nr:HAMP domain-containing sensor histidine kinase [Bacteroidales bacterium]